MYLLYFFHVKLPFESHSQADRISFQSLKVPKSISVYRKRRRCLLVTGGYPTNSIDSLEHHRNLACVSPKIMFFYAQLVFSIEHKLFDRLVNWSDHFFLEKFILHLNKIPICLLIILCIYTPHVSVFSPLYFISRTVHLRDFNHFKIVFSIGPVI